MAMEFPRARANGDAGRRGAAAESGEVTEGDEEEHRRGSSASGIGGGGALGGGEGEVGGKTGGEFFGRSCLREYYT